MKAIALLISFSTIAGALTKDGLVEITKIKCDIKDLRPIEDYDEDCALDVINCAVDKTGEIDIKHLNECLDKKRGLK